LLHLLIIDILATAVALKIGDGLAANLQDLQNKLQKKRYGI